MGRTVSVKLMADVSNFTREIGGRASGSVKTLSGELDRANKAGKLDHVTNQAGMLGLGLLGAAGAAIKMAADFDKQMSAVSAATHASAGEIDQLRAAAIQAGKDTQYSATEAAKGITELSKAGVSTADVLNGGLKGALSLAAAGQIDVGDAAETAASAMTQFKLKGDQIPHVADLLAAGAGKAQGSVEDMSQALNQSGLIAAQTGLTIEDTTGTLAAFASAGLTGSDAGTSFKTMLQALQAPSGKTKDLMDELGISAYDAQGSFIGITGLAGQLKDKLSKLTPELRANALAQIFGSDATRAASVLYEQGADGIQKWIDKTNDAGYAADTAAKLTDNLSGDLERLKGSLETMAIEGGSGANSGLRVIVKSLGALVDEFGQLPPAVGGTVTVLAGLGGALLLGGVAWVKYRAAVAAVNEQLIATGPAGEKAAAGLGKAQKAAGIATAAFVALEVVGAVFDQFAPAAADVDKLTSSLQEFSNTGRVTGEMAADFGTDMKGFREEAGLASMATGGFTKTINDLLNTIKAGSVADWMAGLTGTSTFNTATADTKSYDAALTSVMTTSGDAKKASELWNRTLEQSGLDTDQLAKVLPNAWKKVGELNNAAMQGATSVGAMGGAEQNAAGQTQQLTDEMKKQADEAAALEKHLEDLFKQYMSADQAAIKLKETIIATNKEFKDGTHTLSLNTEEGRKNRSAVLDRLSAIEDMREAEIKSTGKTDEANQKYRDQVGDLKKTLAQMGFNRTEIGKLINKYEDIPGKVDTKVTISGDKAVGQKLALFSQIQAALKKGTQLPAPARRMFDLYDGGGWTGPGGMHDPAGIVHADEHVIRKTSRRKVEQKHPGLLDHINAHGDLPPGYADGGRVWPFPVSAAMTRVPSATEVRNAVTPPVPSGGMTYKWIERAVNAAFPGMAVLSDYRPGARTLSGAESYHAFGRAVDYPPSRPLAEWFNVKYFSQIKELITPWNDLNIHNGQRHAYTGAVWNQHNVAGGNAHDHIAMAGGGVINEPVYGYGLSSGRSYSFAERGTETVIPGRHSMAQGGAGTTVILQLHNHGVIGSQYEMDSWLASGFDRLKKRGRV